MALSKKHAEQICHKLGAELLRYRLIGSSGLNECHLLTTSKAKYVLKICNNDRFGIREYKYIRLAGNLAPNVLLFDKSKSIIPKMYMVQEFLEGRHSPKKITNEFLSMMAKYFKRLHKVRSSRIDSDERKCSYSLSYWAKRSYDRFIKMKKPIEGRLLKSIENYFTTTLKHCEENDHIFRNRKSFPLVHGDAWQKNIFIEKNNIKLIDWEFAGFVLGERDLIIFMRTHDLTRQQRNYFLRAYGYPQTELAEKKFSLISELLTCSDIRWLLERLTTIETGKIETQQPRNRKEITMKIRKLLSE